MTRLKYHRKAMDECPNKDNHTDAPSNYVDWVQWAWQMEKTHEQIKCPSCDLYVIWVPKEPPPHDDLGEPQVLDYR